MFQLSGLSIKRFYTSPFQDSPAHKQPTQASHQKHKKPQLSAD